MYAYIKKDLPIPSFLCYAHTHGSCLGLMVNSFNIPQAATRGVTDIHQCPQLSLGGADAGGGVPSFSMPQSTWISLHTFAYYGLLSFLCYQGRGES